MNEEKNKNNGYTKRPLWQWILIYILVAGAVYGLVYYFVLAKKSGYNYNNSASTPISNRGQKKSYGNQPLKSQNLVQIASYNFSPKSLTVKTGESVTWTNQDSVGHSATADSESFDTGILSQGQSNTVIFAKAGTFTYHCSLHPGMKGTIIVQ